MGLILALIAALSISTIPLLVGWRRTVTEALEFGLDPVAALRAAYPERLLAAVLPDAVKAFAPR